MNDQETKDLRAALGWTQQQTADFLHIPRGTYSKYEVASSAGGKPITGAHAALLRDELNRKTESPITALVPMSTPGPATEESLFDRVLLRATDIVLAIGMRQSGKSTFMAKRLKPHPRFVAIDPTHDFGIPGVPITPRVHPDLDQQIVRPLAKDSEDMRRQCVQAVEAARAMGNLIIYIDELMSLSTSRSMPPALYQAVFYGGHAGVSVWASTQRGINIPTDLPAMCSVFFLFNFRLENERKAIAANLSIDPDCVPREEHAVTVIARQCEPFTRDLNERRRTVREQQRNTENHPNADDRARIGATLLDEKLQQQCEQEAQSAWDHWDRPAKRVHFSYGEWQGTRYRITAGAYLEDFAREWNVVPEVAWHVIQRHGGNDERVGAYLKDMWNRYPALTALPGGAPPQSAARHRPSATPARAHTVLHRALPATIPDDPIDGEWRDAEDGEEGDTEPEPTTARRGLLGTVRYPDDDQPAIERIGEMFAQWLGIIERAEERRAEALRRQ